MPKIRLPALNPYLVSTLGIFSVFMFLFLLWGEAYNCTASDFDPKIPLEKTFSGFTKAGACSKAVVICSYYSPEPKNCRIKK